MRKLLTVMLCMSVLSFNQAFANCSADVKAYNKTEKAMTKILKNVTKLGKKKALSEAETKTMKGLMTEGKDLLGELTKNETHINDCYKESRENIEKALQENGLI